MKIRTRLAAALGLVTALAAPAPAALAQSFACTNQAGRTVSRVIGGHDIAHEDAPYQVGMYVLSADQESMSLCGGSLISRSYILTAAHCLFKADASGREVVVGPDQVFVMLGGDDRDEMVDRSQLIMPARVIVHEGYDPARVTSPNDIALLELGAPLDIPDGWIVPLASDRMERALVGDATCARVTGYGRREDGETSNHLQAANLYIAPRAECRRHNRAVTDSMLCAGFGGDRNSCNGDSGGPLVIREGPTGWVQVGIVSWGRRGCDDALSVYTRVSSFIPWILAETGG